MVPEKYIPDRVLSIKETLQSDVAKYLTDSTKRKYLAVLRRYRLVDPSDYAGYSTVKADMDRAAYMREYRLQTRKPNEFCIKHVIKL